MNLDHHPASVDKAQAVDAADPRREKHRVCGLRAERLAAPRVHCRPHRAGRWVGEHL